MSTTPKLDALLNGWPESDMSAALAEIREHLQRIPAPAPEATQSEWRPAERWPSEIETRLIELLTSILTDPQIWERYPHSQAQLQSEFAAIKRDLGIS